MQLGVGYNFYSAKLKISGKRNDKRSTISRATECGHAKEPKLIVSEKSFENQMFEYSPHQSTSSTKARPSRSKKKQKQSYFA